ncbi:serine hydrolase domain-containing protein [Paenibacillus segetis]|uniref:Penicillin-binding protein n=1 Tax=Paenibacillus segetis TaxID=1325360 RepID=A0ABQ1YPQ9_9BACL|nr:serine hydrolase [Paenibacillus segetis]GGH31890.1 penicillin-binding protein [Paenibacillus segetis]
MRKLKWITVFILLMAMIVTGCMYNGPKNSIGSMGQNEGKAFVWPESTPSEQGMNQERLTQAEEQILSNHRRIDSLLIIKNGYLVYEKYFNGKSGEMTTGVFSITKSIISALTGIAIEQGYITGTDQKLSSVLTEMSKQSDSQKMNITIHDALTLSGGLASVDDDFENWIQSPDYLQFAMDKPMVSDPGTVFKYSTGLPHMLSVILTRTTGMSTKEYADQNLFGPLDIVNYQWQQDSTGMYNGGTNLSMLPRDMAKLGYLYLQHGKWRGEQIIPEAWVDESTRKQINVDADNDYGYLFWLKMMSDGQGNKISAYEAVGYGGQHIRVIPELNTVVVITSNIASSEVSDPNELMEKYILPALR